jgi:hypothetical protein
MFGKDAAILVSMDDEVFLASMAGWYFSCLGRMQRFLCRWMMRYFLRQWQGGISYVDERCSDSCVDG